MARTQQPISLTHLQFSQSQYFGVVQKTTWSFLMYSMYYDAIFGFRCRKNAQKGLKAFNINLKNRSNTPVLMTLCACFSPRPIPQGKFCLCKTVKYGNPSECHPTALQTAGEQPTFSYKCMLYVSSPPSERTLTGFLWDQSDVITSHSGMWCLNDILHFHRYIW